MFNLKNHLLVASLSLVMALVACTTETQIETPIPDVLTRAELEAQVADIYDQIDKKFDISFETGIDFVIANNYPGAFDAEKLKKCAYEKLPYLGDNVTGGKPRVETLTLIPDWVGRESAAADWLLSEKQIPAEVYRFDLEVDLEIITAEVAVYEGRVYLLYGWCDD